MDVNRSEYVMVRNEGKTIKREKRGGGVEMGEARVEVVGKNRIKLTLYSGNIL